MLMIYQNKDHVKEPFFLSLGLACLLLQVTSAMAEPHCDCALSTCLVWGIMLASIKIY